LLVVTLAAGSLITARDYTAWVTRADLFYETDADLAAAARWATANTDGPVYIAAQDRFHPTAQAFNLPAVRWLGTDTLFLPPDGPRVALFPRSAPPTDAMATWLDEAATPITDLPLGPDGRTAFTAYRLLPDASHPLAAPDLSVRNAHLSLVGVFNGGAFPNARTDILTAWRVDSPPTAPDLTPIVHMEDSLGNLIARAESFSMGTDSWETGETLIQRVPELRVPVGTPPGLYPLRMTWVERSTDTYLPYQGETGGVWATVGTLEILRPNSFPPAADLPTDVRVDRDLAPGVRLVGWDNFADTARPGETLALTIYWQGTEAGERADLRYDLMLGDTAITLNAPLLSEQPTSSWLPGQLMTERLQITIDREQIAGTYPLHLVGNDGTEIELGNLAVEGVPRLFEPPPVATVITEPIGDTLELYGYTLTTMDDTLTVELVWRARAPVNIDYTVFVHLTDPDTGTNIAQQDQMPQNNTYPTRLWQAGEYIVDRYAFALPTTTFGIRVGLYDATTGQRLPTTTPVNAVELALP
jgi:hypothetical protein